MIYLHVFDEKNEFYTNVRLRPDLNFDTGERIDPTLSDQISAFLQIYRLQNSTVAFEQTVGSYKMFSWEAKELPPNIIFSEIDSPRIVFAICAKNEKEQAIRMRLQIMNSSRQEEDFKNWLSEIKDLGPTENESVTITGGTFINTAISNKDVSNESTISVSHVGDLAPESNNGLQKSTKDHPENNVNKIADLVVNVSRRFEKLFQAIRSIGKLLGIT